MFDDFQPSATTKQSRARLRNSAGVAIVLFGVSATAIVAASNRVIKIVEEEMTKVEFAPPPEPEPPPPPPPPVAPTPKPMTPRPKMKRPDLAPPDKISDEKLKESNKELATAGTSGPVNGYLDGTPGGTGNGKAAAPPPPPPPPPKAAPLVLPVASAVDQPRYPAPAKRKGIEGSVVVEFDVMEDGHVANPKIVSGPAEFHETVLKAAMGWKFKPATRGGKPLRYRMKKTVTFRLEDA